MLDFFVKWLLSIIMSIVTGVPVVYEDNQFKK